MLVLSCVGSYCEHISCPATNSSIHRHLCAQAQRYKVFVAYQGVGTSSQTPSLYLAFLFPAWLEYCLYRHAHFFL